MAEINQEIKELQKLGKMELIVLLGELDEEIEGFERENQKKESRIKELMQENEALREENSDLAQKNKALMSQITAANKKLLEREERSVNMQAVEAVARQMSEMARQTGRQVSMLREMESERRRNSTHATQSANEQAQSIIEAAQLKAVDIAKQLQKTNLEMLANMQAAINHARSGYEAAFTIGLDGKEQAENKICEFPAQADGARAKEEQVVLSVEQARNLLKVLKRFKKQETVKRAE